MSLKFCLTFALYKKHDGLINTWRVAVKTCLPNVLRNRLLNRVSLYIDADHHRRIHRRLETRHLSPRRLIESLPLINIISVNIWIIIKELLNEIGSIFYMLII